MTANETSIALLLAGIALALLVQDVKGQARPARRRPFKQSTYDTEVSDVYMAGLGGYHSVLYGISRALGSYDHDGIMPLEVSDSMRQDIMTFTDKMVLAEKNAKELIKDVDSGIEKKTNEVSKLEERTRDLKKSIKEAQVRKSSAENNLKLHQARLATEQANLKTHQEALRLAKERKDKARHECISGGRRRRKRGLFKKLKKIHKKLHGHHKKVHRKVTKVHRKITDKLPGGKLDRKIHKKIESGACALVDVLTGNIKKEAKAVDAAKRSVAQQTKKIARAQRTIAVEVRNIAKHEKSISGYKAKLDYSKKKLPELKKSRDMLIEVDAKLKKVSSVIASVRARAEVVKLNTELGFLLDVEGVTKPLMEVGDIVLKHNTLRSKSDYALSTTPAQIREMKAKLAEIAAATPAGQ